jgi:hypothetical protein
MDVKIFLSLFVFLTSMWYLKHTFAMSSDIDVEIHIDMHTATR